MGVGERRGGRRAGGHRRANHRHNHHNHHHNHPRHIHHHGRLHGGIHGNRRMFRGPGLSTFGWRRRGGNRGGNQGGPPVAVTPVHCVSLMMLIMLGMFGFIAGMTLANIGGWLASSVGIAGMVVLLISAILLIIVIVLRCHMQKLSPQPAVGMEAGTLNPNMTVSNVTLQGGSATVSQVGETTSYIIQTGAMQPGGVAMGTQPGYPGGPAQPYPPPSQNYPVAPYPPYPNGAAQYPPPTNPPAASMPYPQLGAAPPVNYAVPYLRSHRLTVIWAWSIRPPRGTTSSRPHHIMTS
ncbi:uncharacterized protein LOC115923868 [Strongylocentrotus purpuratus]|uniref:Uncharacterized protein n=1 Tax=Strongylocentrotus purpuratus TaxID=7668 RepID=A0A7M7NUG0_STRPU|nr:uncharacterized protein LOC115923868 [Strongylocentrotus purpuratus]